MIKIIKPVKAMSRRAQWALCFAVLMFFAAALYLLWTTARAERAPAELESFAMGSYVRQTVWGGESVPAAAYQRISELENLISWRREGSDTALINAAAGKRPAEIDEYTFRLLEEVLELCGRSGGALDVTLGPVTRLWDFDSSPHVPDTEALESALALVDSQKCLLGEDAALAFSTAAEEQLNGKPLDSCAALADGGMALDLGAVGKGAACDAAVREYQEAGADAAVIAVGGSVGLYGEKPGGEPWIVSVRDPGSQESLGILELSEGFVSTSGSYEKCFVQDGTTYHHLLDPHTGYPASSGLVSVTVFCPPGYKNAGALSDGLATACFVLGLDESLPLLESYGAQALFVTEDSEIFLTGELLERFSLTAGGNYTIAEGR